MNIFVWSVPPVMAWALIFGGLLLIGFLSLVIKIRRQVETINFFNEYAGNYYALANRRDYQETRDNRTWLIRNSQKMNDLMGSYGYVHNSMTGNQTVALHLVPDICNELGISEMTPLMLANEMNATNNALLRFEGVLHEQYDLQVKELKHPIRWLTEGVRRILTLPAVLLKELGILPGLSYRRMSDSKFIEFLSGIASLATIIGLCIQIWQVFPHN